MASTLQRQEHSHDAPERIPASPGADRTRARAFLIAGLAWACVVLLSWLGWWQIGEGGREALARTVGLSADQLTPYVLVALIAEKLAAKGLLFASLYHWLKSR